MALRAAEHGEVGPLVARGSAGTDHRAITEQHAMEAALADITKPQQLRRYFFAPEVPASSPNQLVDSQLVGGWLPRWILQVA